MMFFLFRLAKFHSQFFYRDKYDRYRLATAISAFSLFLTFCLLEILHINKILVWLFGKCKALLRKLIGWFKKSKNEELMEKIKN